MYCYGRVPNISTQIDLTPGVTPRVLSVASVRSALAGVNNGALAMDKKSMHGLSTALSSAG